MFFRTVIAGRRYQSFQLLYLLGCRCAFIEMQPVIWQHQLKISIFTVILPLFHKEQSKRFILSTVVCLLHNTVCSYPLLQEDSICLKKSKGIVSILETAIAVAFFQKKCLFVVIVTWGIVAVILIWTILFEMQENTCTH